MWFGQCASEMKLFKEDGECGDEGAFEAKLGIYI
jgi:hypothetical protein